MAEIIKTFLAFSAMSAELAFTGASGSETVTLDNADGRVTLFVKNANTQNTTVTLKAGDGSLSSLGDIVLTVAGSKSVSVPFSRVESARVKKITGDDKGKVYITSSVDSGGTLANLSFAVLSVE